MKARLSLIFRSKKLGMLLLIASPVLLALAVASFQVQHVPDPVYDGLHFSDWMKQLAVQNSFHPLSSNGYFPMLDSNAIPAINAELRNYRSFYGKNYFLYWNKTSPGIRRWMPSPFGHDLARVRLIDSLAHQPQIAAPVIPILIDVLKYSAVETMRMASAEALGRIGTNAANAMVALKLAQSDTSVQVQKIATESLKNFSTPRTNSATNR